ncbi:MAG: hypothetical protein JNL74_01760, partial [Fibrobacteres bacterium]|nr:hypothetical protein [Fibrobacterota bacterium]
GGYVSDTVTDSTDPGQSGTYSLTKRIFRYVGEWLGDYKPGRKLIAPLQHDIGHAGYTYKDSIFNIKGEFSASSKDTNRLSNLDDGDNRGFAFYNNLSVRLSRVTLKIRQEERSKNFRALSTVEDPYLFSRKWNYNSRNSDPFLSILEGGAVWNASDAFTINGEGGRLKRRNFSAERGEFSLSITDLSGSRAQINGEGIRSHSSDTTRDIIRAGADGEKRGGVVIPRLTFMGEYSDECSGAFYSRKTLTAEGKMGARNGKYGIITGESELSGRIDRKTAPGDAEKWLDSAMSVTFVNKGYLDFGREFRADIAFTHRSSRRDEGSEMNTVRSNLITFQGSSELKERAVDQRMMYSLSTEQSQQLVPVYIPVDAGMGTHIKDPLTQDYILREGGNYIYGGQVADTNAALKDALKSLFSYRLTFTPGRLPILKNDKNILKYLSFQTYWNAEQDMPSDVGVSAIRRYLPDFDPVRATESNALQYRLEAREELLLDDTERRYSVRVRFIPRYRYTFRSEGDRDNWNSIAWSVSGRHLLKEKAQFEHTLEQEEVTRSSGRTATDYNVVTSRGKTTCDVEINKVVSLPIIVNGGISTTSISDIGRVPFAALSIGLILSKPEKGRGEVHYSISNVMYEGISSLPYDAADGEKAGITHKANGSVKVNATKNIDLDLSVFWERNSIEARSWIRGNMELRAYF